MSFKTSNETTFCYLLVMNPFDQSRAGFLVNATVLPIIALRQLHFTPLVAWPDASLTDISLLCIEDDLHLRASVLLLCFLNANVKEGRVGITFIRSLDFLLTAWSFAHEKKRL